ncbi:MAG: cytochrome D1 domain-containing protein [Pseudomonas sp.]|uniref:YVTN family beta-propeller repeat protein n=1 Tax=Pseudomonas sp. TaxID=306 RepID=UPI002735A019|nr:cytochrome D1 domain-containing protein [Pseudomonas sp.]MDP3845570.1 cytochrome D1 domain-containing protein [Pseudomonas sp.]
MSTFKLLLASTLTLALNLAWAAPVGTVYTANERDSSISQVRLATGETKTIALNIAPHNLQVSADDRWLLVVGMPAHAQHQAGAKSGGELQVFSTAALDKPAFSLPAGEHPAHVVTDLSGQRAFVSDSAANLLRVFDLGQRKQIATVKTGSFPHGLRLSPDGKALYVANMRGASVSVIDTATLKETAQIAVGKAPVQVGFAPDGRQAYVSLSGENALGIIDTQSQRLSGKVAVGRTPVQMYATVDGRQVYVANQGSSTEPDDRVSVVDPQTLKVVATLTTGKGAHGVAISRDGAYVFVSNLQAGTFSVIDSASRQVIANHRVGAGPNGISYQAPE